MSKYINLNMPVAHILTNPSKDWGKVLSDSRGKNRYAFREIEVNWNKYNPFDYLFSHVSIVSSVKTDETGYRIVSPCDELVNANGNAWTNQVLPHCFKTFIGGYNFEEHCFVSGTKVTMADGEKKNIEHLQPGEFVLNRLGEKDEIKNIQIRETKEIYIITLKDKNKTEIKVTGNHPFWTYDKEDNTYKWIEVKDLNEYSNLLSSNEDNDSICFKKDWFLYRFNIQKQKLKESIEVYNIEVEKDNSYIANSCVVHNCQIPELSKGIILDAVLRPVMHKGKNGATAQVYICDLLVATDRKHENLIKRIESGELKTLSMGGLAAVTQCSVCGRIIKEGEENCLHLDNYLKQYVTCKDGKKHICSELCGALDPITNEYIKDSFVFVECSWVRTPAFAGAVVNYFVDSAQHIKAKKEENKLASIWDGEEFLKLRVADEYSGVSLKLARSVYKELKEKYGK